MQQRTPQQAHQEKGLRKAIRTVNPEVPGRRFWPVMFGMAATLQQLVTEPIGRRIARDHGPSRPGYAPSCLRARTTSRMRSHNIMASGHVNRI